MRQLRQGLRLLHRWAGFGAGLVFVVLGLTGSVAVYQHELDAWLNPEFHAPLAGAQSAPLQTVLDAALAELPPIKSALLAVPSKSGQPLRMNWQPLDNPTGLSFETSLHPESGLPLAQRFASGVIAFDRRHVLDTLYDLHVTLWMDDFGFTIVGIASLILLGMAITGLWLAWPRRGNWRVVLTIKPRMRGVRRDYDLHRVGGIYPWLVLVVVSFSGSYFVFPEAFHALAKPISEVESFPRGIQSSPAAGRSSISLDQAVQIARLRYPDGEITFINPAFAERDFIRVRLRQPGELLPRGQTRLWLDRYTGEVLAQTEPKDASAATRFFNLQLPLHSGDALGAVGRVLVFVTGLVPLLLFITALRIWLHRRRRSPAFEQP